MLCIKLMQKIRCIVSVPFVKTILLHVINLNLFLKLAVILKIAASHRATHTIRHILNMGRHLTLNMGHRTLNMARQYRANMDRHHMGHLRPMVIHRIRLAITTDHLRLETDRSMCTTMGHRHKSSPSFPSFTVLHVTNIGCWISSSSNWICLPSAKSSSNWSSSRKSSNSLHWFVCCCSCHDCKPSTWMSLKFWPERRKAKKKPTKNAHLIMVSNRKQWYYLTNLSWRLHGSSCRRISTFCWENFKKTIKNETDQFEWVMKR